MSHVIGLDGIDAFDALPEASKTALKNTKVFFFHMSVGENLLMGYNNWSAPWKGGTAFLGFPFGKAASVSFYGTGRLGHDAFGQNGLPLDKIAMFRTRMLTNGFGAAVKVAGMKFCYNDLTTTTTPLSEVIAAYDAAFQAVESGTTGVVFFHITTPLQPANQYNTVPNNQLRISFANSLRTKYASGRHVVLDLQEIQSTDAVGASCSQSGTPVLCSDWAADKDGHLNDSGSTRAAKAFLYALHVARCL